MGYSLDARNFLKYSSSRTGIASVSERPSSRAKSMVCRATPRGDITGGAMMIGFRSTSRATVAARGDPARDDVARRTGLRIGSPWSMLSRNSRNSPRSRFAGRVLPRLSARASARLEAVSADATTKAMTMAAVATGTHCATVLTTAKMSVTISVVMRIASTMLRRIDARLALAIARASAARFARSEASLGVTGGFGSRAATPLVTAVSAVTFYPRSSIAELKRTVDFSSLIRSSRRNHIGMSTAIHNTMIAM